MLRIRERRVHEVAGVVLAASILVAGALPRVSLALTNENIYWPDEIYQSLEPAHRLVFGYGWLPMEYSAGLRTWAMPGFVAVLLASATALGFSDSLQYVHFTKVAFALLAVATAWGSYWLARAYAASGLAAAAGVAFFALAAPAIYFGPRALSENASAFPIVVGLAYVLGLRSSRAQRFFGNVLLGIAVILRLHNALFCVGVVLVVLARRRKQDIVDTLAAYALCAFCLGLLDRLTWGEWFQSARRYLYFSVIEGKSASWGSAPATFYVEVLWDSMGPLALAATAIAVAAVRRAWALCAIVALFLVAHSATAHKELRFILPALPLIGALAGIGLDEIGRRRRAIAIVAAGVLLACAVASARSFRTLTVGQLGHHVAAPPELSAYEVGGLVNRLLASAGKRADVCGVRVQNAHWAWTGGYTYLHRKVPLYDQASVDSTHFNYVITYRDVAPFGDLADNDGRLLLVRTRDHCAPDPQYSYFK